MALPKNKFREIVFQALYCCSLSQKDTDGLIPMLMSEQSVSKRHVREAVARAEKILELKPELDTLISNASTAYEFDRIQTVERNVLRLGAYEILHDEEIPPKVAISEAIRLTRKFSTREAAAFINAMLDNIYRHSEGETVDEKAMEEAAETLAMSVEIAEKAGAEEVPAEEPQNDENSRD